MTIATSRRGGSQHSRQNAGAASRQALLFAGRRRSALDLHAAREKIAAMPGGTCLSGTASAAQA